MNIDEAKTAIRAAKAGFAVPTFLATEAVIAVCDVLFDQKSSSRDKLRAVETLVAIERLQIELKARTGAEPEGTLQVVNINLSLDDWKIIRERGISVKQYIRELEIRPKDLLNAEPLPPAPLSPQALLHRAG